MWSLYENDTYLKPLVFSNSKTQEDVVDEIIESINSGCKIIFIKGVCGSGKCLEKDTLIFCKPDNEEYFSYYKISDLVNKEGIVLSVDKEGNIVKSRFKNVRETGEKEIHKLKTSTGREIFASKNHPFLIINKKGIEWLPLENLDNNSYICLPNRINLSNNLDYDENKLKILAYLIAEGKLGGAGSPVYTQDPIENPDTREDYISALRKVFPEGEIKQYKKDVKLNFRLMDTRFGTTNKLRLFVRKHGLDGKRSAEKFAPKLIFNLKNEKIALFLRILFSCDGSIYEKRTKIRKSKQTMIEYASISDRLIKDISILLSILGIQHTITKKRFKEISDYSKRINITNQKGVRKFIEKIGFIGRKQKLALDLYKNTKIHKFTNIDKVPRIIREYLKNKGYSYLQLDRFLNYEEIEDLKKEVSYKKIRNEHLIKAPRVFIQGKINFLREHLRKINYYIKDKVLSFISNEDIVWDKVKSIEYVKKDKTYDLEVENFHNFIANGIIVHNSAIALNLAKEIGKASIVVPIKNLQKQYEEDYTNKKYLLKNNKKLKIKIITGRSNHQCPYLRENAQEFKIEKDSKLTDFDSKNNEDDNFEMNLKVNKSAEDFSCNNTQLPCKIEIKEKNFEKIKEYLKKNTRINLTDFINVSLRKVRRMSIAPVCQYWSPIVPSEINLDILEGAICKRYTGLKNRDYTIYQRREGCGYYNQFDAYLDSDAIIFNSQKYKLETLMDRKPATDIEIIDECDEFLDSFSNHKKINLNRLNFALGNLYSMDNKTSEVIDEMITITRDILKDEKIEEAILNEGIMSIKETKIFNLLKNFLDSELMWLAECDEENYCYYVDEVARTFDGFFEETYVSFYREDKDIVARIITTNLEKRFKELLDKNKTIVMMSGTIHSENVLRNIFGLTDFKIIDAETKTPGKITYLRTGLEINCKYQNFSSGKITREQYLLALEKCIELAKKPALVHVVAFRDLPTEQEVEKYNLNIISQEKLKNLQAKENVGEKVKKFKNNETEILYSTKCNRGVDFPGETCNSIILTKYPYPNVKSVFWRILKKNKPQHYNEFYIDKSKREFLQRIYRGLRSKDDHIFLLSPDARVLNSKNICS